MAFCKKRAFLPSRTTTENVQVGVMDIGCGKLNQRAKF